MHTFLRSFGSAFLLVVTLLAAQENPSITAKNVQTPLNGGVSGATYTNNFLGFSYPLPEGFFPNNEVPTKSDKSGTYYLLIADRNTDTSFKSRFIIVADSSDAYRQPLLSLKDYVAKLVTQTAKVENSEVIKESAPFDFPGREFYSATYKQTSGSTMLHKIWISALVRSYFVSWIFVSNSYSQLNEIAASVRQTNFFNPNVIGMPAGVSNPSELKLPKRVRVSQKVSQTLLVEQIRPNYPEEARKNHVQGKVVLHAVISREGEVKELTLVSGDTLLSSASLEAVKHWKYQPYLLQGEPVEIDTQITVDFVLSP